MKNCPLYNGENLDFTGHKNPYGLIQKGGKRKTKKIKKIKKIKNRKRKGTRKYEY
jgi:hypothetical protein